jgi:hypothetical protein
MRTWRPLLDRRLKPNLHTRVGGVCLFQSGFYPTDAGEAWQNETKLLISQHANIELPAGLISDLMRYESTEEDIEPP